MKTSTYQPVGRYINLMFDRGFKRVFGKPANKDILIAFLNEVIPDRHIVDLEYLNTEKEGLSPFSKKSIFDVQCLIDDGSRIIIEIQKANQDNFCDRAVYYASLPVLDQLEMGEEYRLVPIIIISILNFTLPHEIDEGRIRTSYTIREDASGERLSNVLQFIFLELGNFKKSEDELDNDTEKWYFCLLNMHKLAERPAVMKAAIFERLFQVAEVEALPQKDKENYIKDMTTERDIINQREFARKEGLAQGIAQGLEQGKAKGLVEGEAKGKAESQREIAKNLAALGMDPATIAKATGLSEEEVRGL